MPDYRDLLLAACITATLLCSVLAFLSAREGLTGRALTYLLVASLPFFVAAVRADAQQLARHPQASTESWSAHRGNNSHK